jgi:hypothetical protein
MTVEPENRTVARELERRWDNRLKELETIRAQAAQSRRGRRVLTSDELARAHELGNHLEAVMLGLTAPSCQSTSDEATSSRIGIGSSATERVLTSRPGGTEASASTD